MKQTKTFLCALASLTLLISCAGVGKRKQNSNFGVDSKDRLFIQVNPLPSTVLSNLEKANLEADVLYENLSKEIHYQLYLSKQEEALDSSSSTIAIQVVFDHIQVGSANIGGRVSGQLIGNKKGKVENIPFDLRTSPGENVPTEYLALHLPRLLAGEILTRVLKSRARVTKTKDSAVPTVLMVF